MAVNETKIDSKVDDQLIAIDDFSLLRNDRNRQGGGVALYVRNTVGFRPRKDFPNKSLEIICIEVEPPHSNPFIVIAWYRPPSEPNSCFDSLQENLSFLIERERKLSFWEILTVISPSHVVQLHELYDLFSMTVNQGAY